MALARFATYVARDRGATKVVIKGCGWRLLAANNRDLARSGRLFDATSECFEAIALLRAAVHEAVPVLLRVGRSDWTWRLRLDDVDLAVSSRYYQRRLQCTAACHLFIELTEQAVIADDPNG